MTSTISIRNWEQFQHYKDRDPPWIKLYRDLLTSESWVLGSDLSRVVQVASVLLAPRYGNKIPLRFDLLKKVMSLDCIEEQFAAAVRHLCDANFFEIQSDGSTQIVVEQSASVALASCTSEQSRAEQSRAEQSRAEQSRAEQSRAEQNPTASATPRNGKTRTVSCETDPEWWLDFKLAYPDRAGDQGWRKAQRAAHARIQDGHTPSEFIAGAKRYAEFIAATEKTGTEFVKQASSFLGPDKPFLLPWTPPLSRAQVRQDKNLDATQIWLREQEAKDAAH